ASIYNNLKYLESKGYLVKEIKTESNGVINLSHLSELIEKYNRNIALVTAMAANNESGVIQPYKEISSLCHEHNIEYFCDSTQIIGKAPFSFQESNADYAVLSGHKIGALPGTGLMLIKNPDQFFPMIIGSGQEGGLRGGTQNYLGNETLAVALNYFNQNLGKLDQLQKYRNYFEQKLQNDFPELVIIGQNGPRLAGTSFLCHPGIHGQAIQIELESDDIFITTSSACSDNEPMTSKVLKSMGVNDKLGRSAIRISLSTSSTEADYESIYQSLKKAYLKLSEIKSF
ncbi:MAG: aminotransferase class V-fold PLP-dependent enzyme, partial [Bdellovibrionales bacterium]|nr:aminotransferase class V-fold PLP-dependent enzyme [Bdellovibrionales bacterium]